MGYYHLTGFPISSQDYRENEVLLTLYTKERGRVVIIVRGAKKEAGTLKAAVHPYNEGHFYVAERRSYDLLSEWELVRELAPEPDDFERVALAAYIGRFLTELISQKERDSGLYRLVKNTFFLLHSDNKYDIIKILFDWGFLKISGLASDVSSCAGCGAGFATGAGYWNMEEGGIFCVSCRAQGAGKIYELRPGSLDFGKAVDAAGTILLRKTLIRKKFDAGSARDFLAGLDSFSETAKGDFTKAAGLFCRYQLHEELGGWLIKL